MDVNAMSTTSHASLELSAIMDVNVMSTTSHASLEPRAIMDVNVMMALGSRLRRIRRMQQHENQPFHASMMVGFRVVAHDSEH